MQQSDPRVPYYGNWNWIAGTSDGSVYSGDASSLTTILDLNRQLVNNGFGAFRWCTSPLCTGDPVERSVGSIATYPDGGGELAAAMDVNESGSFRWVFIDGDKKVGSLGGLPLLDGVGFFNTPDGVRRTGYFVMVQTSTDPRRTVLPTPATSAAMQELLNQKLGAGLAAQSASGRLDRIQELYKQFRQR